MEINDIQVTQESTSEVKKCKCCGQYKPLFKFDRKGKGYSSICTECKMNKDGVSPKFKDFTSRELIEKIKNRGYKGTLKLVKVEEVVL